MAAVPEEPVHSPTSEIPDDKALAGTMADDHARLGKNGIRSREM